MNALKKGFTLIEMLIVVAIMAVLAAIAIPQYQDYVTKSLVVEAFTLMDGAKTTVQTNIENHATCTSPYDPNTFTGKYGTLTISGSYTENNDSPSGRPVGCRMTYIFKNNVNSKLDNKSISALILDNGATGKGDSINPVDEQYLPEVFKRTAVE